jgi:hypothetical protein
MKTVPTVASRLASPEETRNKRRPEGNPVAVAANAMKEINPNGAAKTYRTGNGGPLRTIPNATRMNQRPDRLIAALIARCTFAISRRRDGK